jgi:hypothetical protein
MKGGSNMNYIVYHPDNEDEVVASSSDKSTAIDKAKDKFPGRAMVGVAVCDGKQQYGFFVGLISF